MELLTKIATATMRNAHGVPIVVIICLILKLKINPPIPDPAAVIPVATLLFFANHWEITPTDPVKRNPIPIPKNTPWVRKRCQICLLNEAAIKAPVSMRTPAIITVRVEVLRRHKVARGPIIMEEDMERPPMKAYIRGVASG
jgi:hypothetical protein